MAWKNVSYWKGLGAPGGAVTKAYVDAGDASTLSSANTYTDTSLLRVPKQYLALGATVTVYVRTTGNDANDGLTAGTAFRTLARAYQALDISPNVLNIIDVGAGTFENVGYHSTNNVLIRATTSSVVSAVLAANTTETYAIISGVTATLNEYRGMILRFVDGTGIGQYARIARNDATSAGSTVVYIAFDNAYGYALMGTSGDNVEIIQEATFLNGATVVRSGSIEFQNIGFTGSGFSLFYVEPSASVTLRRCNTTGIDAIRQLGGLLTMSTCYIAGDGNTEDGIFHNKGGITHLIGGNVFYGGNAGDNNFMLCQRNSTIDHNGPAWVTAMAGWFFEGSRYLTSFSPGAWNALYFDSDCTGPALISADINSIGASSRSSLRLPLMPYVGYASSTLFMVYAKNGAYVKVDPSTYINTLNGVNVVTVDGLNLGNFDNQGTYIIGAVPNRKLDSEIRCFAYSNTTSLASSSNTPWVFQHDYYNVGLIHSAGTEHFIAPEDGEYAFCASASCQSTSGTFVITLTGTYYLAQTCVTMNSALSTWSLSASGRVYLAAGQYIYLNLFQNSGASRNSYAYLQAAKCSP